MEIVPVHFFLLAAYHLIFYRKFIENPFRMCTSELASTYFPFWRYLKGRILFKDDIYYPYPASIPFLSNFYPTHLLTSFLSQFLSLDNSFRLFSFHILIHSFFSSILSYFMFLQWYSPTASLFGAISIGYMAYAIKPFTPSAMYTMCWIPGCFIKGIVGQLSLGMAFLGGYWPVLAYIFPFMGVSNPDCFKGLILAIPQIIPFLWYWKKSVRYQQVINRKEGKVPLWRYLDLIIPNRTQNTINGVFWPEMAMYIGVIPFLMLKPTLIWIIGIVCSLTVQIQRIQARALYLLSFSILMMAVNNDISIYLVFIQAFMLLQNSGIYPHFPFCQWWEKPSKLYKKYKETEWPNWSGYIQNKHIKWYEGGFSLK